MKISLYEFLQLPDKKQYELIFSIGEYVDCSVEGDQRFILYAIDRFFVEVEYDQNQNKIVNNRAFLQGRILDKYARL